MPCTDDFSYLVLSIVEEVPKGKVASYGQIAKLAGYPKNARKVGTVLSNASIYGNYPCHRIVTSTGGIVVGWKEQRELLLEEGVTFVNNYKVDMKKHQWNTEKG